ncbi:MarR family winged helix-turn-helix transcriptional regulator [Peptoniphilus obesi]|uniref:MarR family winged helix-turn-helix transcriptional regulator n=1 Tax=Peptoniphilus obesi TaxID=1472765 RepID=UPI0004B55C79|nr:MarR family transcriptional regulator [Peptoniphilus obesi]
MYFWDQHKNITSYYEFLSKSLCDKYQLRQMDYDTLMFLYNNPNYNTAADIVKVRKVTKSHLSISLKYLEEKGLIARKQSQDNKKQFEIFLLDKAKDIAQEGINLQGEFMKNMFEGITEEEMEIFKNVFDKICKNADRLLKIQK